MTAKELLQTVKELAEQYKEKGNVWSPEIWLETPEGFLQVDRIHVGAGGIYIVSKEIGK